MPDCWLDVSVRKVLRPATSIQVLFLGFPVSLKQMLRWFPSFQVATTCFSCSPPDVNLVANNFMFLYTCYNHCHRVTTQLQLNKYYYYYIIIYIYVKPSTQLIGILLYFMITVFRTICRPSSGHSYS